MHQSTLNIYKGCQKAKPKKRENQKKLLPLIQSPPNQQKSIEGIEPSPMYKLTHDLRLHKNQLKELSALYFQTPLDSSTSKSSKKCKEERPSKPSSFFVPQKNHVNLEESPRPQRKGSMLGQTKRIGSAIESLPQCSGGECDLLIPLRFYKDHIYQPTTILSFEANPQSILCPSQLSKQKSSVLKGPKNST